jgi:hypothetical protein
MSALKKLFVLCVASLSLSACGNIFADRNLVSRQLALSGGPVQPTGSGAGSTVFEGGFECSYQASIFPNQTDYLGNGEYRVCTNPTNPNMVRIHGSTFFESRVCVYPIQYIDGQGVFLKKDPRVEDDTPYFDCQNISNSTGNVYTFFATQFNGLIVVEGSMNESYLQCISSGDPSTCDPYVLKYVSSGRFR